MSTRIGHSAGVRRVLSSVVPAFGAACVAVTPVQTASAQFAQRNLVSDGTAAAEHVDPNLVNAWGIVPNPTGVWWVSDAATGLSTLYDGEGAINSLVVAVPSAANLLGGAPTGIVFNGSSQFVVSFGFTTGAARFIFAGEDGTISGWAPAVPAPPPSTMAILVVDNSQSHSVYKGLGLAPSGPAGPARLYATDFHNRSVHVFNDQFAPVNVPDAFVDPDLPPDYAPFGIRVVGNHVYVSYALADAAGAAHVAGPGQGYISVFDRDGQFLARVHSQGVLDAPWGFAVAPPNFGSLSGSLLVGNAGDGRIHAFDASSGALIGALTHENGDPIVIDGLWGLEFGNAVAAGPNNVLYFAAGPEGGKQGLFGRLDLSAEERCDFDRNGAVNAADLATLLAAWGGTVNAADVNGDKIVNAADLGVLLESWTSTR